MRLLLLILIIPLLGFSQLVESPRIPEGNLDVSGNITATGKIIADESTHLFAYFGDSTVTFSTTTAWKHFTNAQDSLYIWSELDGFTVSGDTITILNAGDYDLKFQITLDGDNTKTHSVRFYNVTKTAGIPTAGAKTTRGSPNFDTLQVSAYAEGVNAGDKIVIQVKSDANSTLHLKNSTIKIYLVHR